MSIEGKTIEEAIQDGIREGIKSRLSNQYGTVGKLVDELINERSQDLVREGVEAAFANETFREQTRKDIAEVVGKSLVKRFAGDIERHVNALKSDPKTRQQIVDALEKIVRQNPDPIPSV